MGRSESEKRKLIRKLLSGAIPEVSVSLIASIAGCKVQEVRDLRREMRDSGELTEPKEVGVVRHELRTTENGAQELMGGP